MELKQYFPFLFFSIEPYTHLAIVSLKTQHMAHAKVPLCINDNLLECLLFSQSRRSNITTEHAHRHVQIISKWTYWQPSFNFHSSNKDRKCIAPENIKCPKKFVDGNFSLSFVCKPPIVCALSKRSVKSPYWTDWALANTQFFRHYCGCDRRINIRTPIIMQFLLLNFKRKINVDILNIN